MIVFKKNYIYELVEKMGKDFDPEFKPDLTPAKCSNSEYLTVGTKAMTLKKNFQKIGLQMPNSPQLARKKN